MSIQPQESRGIKIIVEGMCPHCNKQIMISSRFSAPLIDWVLKPEDLKKVKERVREDIGKLSFKDEESKKDVLAWLDSEDTLFGPDEAEAVVAQIIKENTDIMLPTEDKKNVKTKKDT